MPTNLVHVRFKWEVACPMSDYMELINPQTMTAKLLKNGEVIADYKVEQCDGCAKITKLDAFGYKVGQAGEKLAWLCGGCR